MKPAEYFSVLSDCVSTTLALASCLFHNVNVLTISMKILYILAHEPLHV